MLRYFYIEGIRPPCRRGDRIPEENEMPDWEYRTFRAGYDKKRKHWVVKIGESPPLVGLQAILDVYGAQGWELVSLNPEHFQVVAGLGKWYVEPEVYRATFKRAVGG
jgi:mannose-6-phosphate isomerase-like protein (cupin superfamily)